MTPRRKAALAGTALVVAGLALVPACRNGDLPAAGPRLPESDKTFRVLPPGAPPQEFLAAIDEGLATEGHSARQWHFVVIRAGERHGAQFRKEAFHVTVGAGVRYPEGALLIRRAWAVSGAVDGTNEQPERYGISIAVEPGAARPYGQAVRDAIAAFVAALATRLPLHPDCVLAMGEIAYTRDHEADLDEKALAAAARARVPVPPAPGTLVIHTEGGDVPVSFERRDTTETIEVGMMFRQRFDGENRGMLFVYPHPSYRNFWMKNCLIPIDVAYILRGRIEQIVPMAPGFGIDQALLPRYESSATADRALEMPAGWFTGHGVKVGDTVEIQ